MDNAKSRKLPVIPLRNSVLFPGTVIPLRVGRKRSVVAMQKAVASDGRVLVVTVKNDKEEGDFRLTDLYRVGTCAKIEQVRGTAEEGFQVIIRGEERVHVELFSDTLDYFEATVEALGEKEELPTKVKEALSQTLKAVANEILSLVPADTSQLAELVKGIDDLGYLTNLCASNLDLPTTAKQELLELESLKDRVLRLLELMQQQRDALEVQGQIRERLSQKLGKEQREAILRHQMNAIREELDEGSEGSGQDNYRKRIDDAGLPEGARKVALEELKRLESIGNNSPEGHVVRNYLDLLCSLPWVKESTSKVDLDLARRVLEEDHYGLDKVKKRVIQHLSVLKLKKDGRAPILLLVGPPGVGKTSLAQSIARAMGRKFARASLGGLRDDAEIRGHRRTYIGAMPGRIIQAIKRAGENNPVFLLDEIDKLARSFSGDPAAALLEVLDPEQNSTFFDHYLDVPFDLSKVVFIATANSLDSIPAPLLDRMEVIDLSGYTTAEKFHIAKRHLIPKQLRQHGIGVGQLEIADEALHRVITHYTREAGVRDLERHLGGLCRSSTEKISELATGESVKVTARDLEEMLGPERFQHDVADRVASPGVVTGLAWTPVGGDILFVESRLIPGSGKLLLTGQLGDVMKESAQIAWSLVKSHLPLFDYEKKDLHIHVPAGAISKDGPSAGVTMLTAIASLVSGRSVNPKLAMTGEVTLRGAVLPVGGVKEKLIAAHRAGVERVILCRRNERDLKEVPEEVRSQLKFEFVETVGDLLKIALAMELPAHAVPSITPGPQAPAAVA